MITIRNLHDRRQPFRARRAVAAVANIMLLSLALLFCLAVLSLGNLSYAQSNDEPSGAALFEQHCSSCHENDAMQSAPQRDVLQTYSAANLEFAINEGVMYSIASVLSADEKASVVDYLAADVDDSWLADTMCSEAGRSVDLNQPIYLSGLGIDRNSSRNMSATDAGLTKADFGNLELAWALAFPDVNALRSSPVMVGDTLFYAATGTRKVFALDAQEGCAKWLFDSPTRLRSSLAYGPLGDEGTEAIVFGDAEGFVYALDARTGDQLWRSDARSHGRSVRLTGSMVLDGNRVYVPVSASGVAQAANPAFECCTGHGEILALDAASGDIVWTYHTMPEADYTGELSSVGTRLRGPSGAPIWSTPTVDHSRNLLFITTGENTSHPATATSDAIIALDLDTGAQKWLFQGLWNDVWNTACGRSRGPNCPDQQPSTLADKDFGGSAVIVRREEGDVLLAGQKSGDLWALNPDTGALLWNQRVGTGTALGGNHWGIATDGERVFLPINDPGRASGTYVPKPGMYSFFVATGEPSWSYLATPRCEGRSERLRNCDSRIGLSATPLLVDGALISAGIDGRFFVFDSVNGEILFEYDSVQDYAAVNGVVAQGGTTDSHGIAAGGGMLFIGAGYGRMGGTPGNTLLAFRPRGQ